MSLTIRGSGSVFPPAQGLVFKNSTEIKLASKGSGIFNAVGHFAAHAPNQSLWLRAGGSRVSRKFFCASVEHIHIYEFFSSTVAREFSLSVYCQNAQSRARASVGHRKTFLIQMSYVEKSSATCKT